MKRHVTTEMLLELKRQGEPIAMLTCYDYPTAEALDAAGIDLALVGDSVGTNMLGYESPREVTMADMLHHTRAVRRGITQALLVSDMPYMSFADPATALANARRLVEAGADMVKLEGGDKTDVVRALKADGIPVMAHIGYTPQTADGSSIVVGAKAAEAIQLYNDALALQEAGADAIVLECIPERVSEIISAKLTIPTIGIGSGRCCDGQVLVVTDLLGWHTMPFRILKQYAHFADRARQAFADYACEVRNHAFPTEAHIFRLKRDELAAFRAHLGE